MKKGIIKLFTVLCIAFSLFLITAFSSNAALVGDVAGDPGKINAEDARLILRVSVELEELTEEKLLIADTNEDGKISAADARMVLRMSVELEDIRHFFTKELVDELTSCVGDNVKYKRTCTECSEHQSYEELAPPPGHKYGEAEILKPVTCNEADGYGQEKYVCIRCNDVLIKDIKCGHLWDIEEATCTDKQVCKRCNAENAALGHTADWGKCSRCNLFITDKYAEQAKTIKASFNEGSKNCEAGYNTVSDGVIEFYSYLKNHVYSARPYYVNARANYEAIINACGDIAELKDIKDMSAKVIANIDATLAQFDVINNHNGMFYKESLHIFVDPIDDANYFASDSIYEINKEISKIIKW